MKRLLKPLDYFFVLRPTLFFPVWTVFLAGFFVQNKYGVSSPATSVPTNGVVGNDLDFVWVGLFLTCLMGASFVLNQIMDRRTDGQNRKLFLIADGHLTPRAAFIESIALSTLALVFGFIFSVNIGVLFIAIFALTGWLYSFAPFKLKDRPVLGLVANGLGAFLIFVGGWIVHGKLTVDAITYSVPYACAVAAVYLLTTLPDIEGDASTKKITFGVKFGFNATIYTALIFESIAVVSSYMAQDELIFYPSLFSLPFFVWAAVTLQLSEVMRAIKYSILLLTFTICIKWVIVYSGGAFFARYAFFFVLLGIYYLSKFYYKFRFGINYPSLSV